MIKLIKPTPRKLKNVYKWHDLRYCRNQTWRRKIKVSSPVFPISKGTTCGWMRRMHWTNMLKFFILHLFNLSSSLMFRERESVTVITLSNCSLVKQRFDTKASISSSSKWRTWTRYSFVRLVFNSSVNGQQLPYCGWYTARVHQTENYANDVLRWSTIRC